MLVDACVPDGCLPGDPFLIEACGIQFEVTVPDNCTAGQLISVELDLPEETLETAVASPAPNPSGSSVSAFEVVVPDGCEAGSPFLVDAAGQQFEVISSEHSSRRLCFASIEWFTPPPLQHDSALLRQV